VNIHFKCVGFISISNSGNGILYPVYGRDGVNASFVQEIDADGKIHDFIEFLEIDHYKFFRYDGLMSRVVGDWSIFAFFSESHLRVEDCYNLGQLIRLGAIDLDGDVLPLLTKLGLARVAQIGGKRQQSIFESYISACDLGVSSGRRMIRIENTLTKKQSHWWDDVYKSENKISRTAYEVKGAAVDDIIRWLDQNPVDNDWKVVCRSLFRRVLFDERIGDLLVKFLNYADDFTEYDVISKAIVGRGIELYSESSAYQGDFEEIIFDKIVDGTIFYLFSVLTRSVMVRFFESIIDRKESEGDHLILIDSMIDYLSANQIIPFVAGSIFDVLIQRELRVAYPQNSFYNGYCRLDRLVYIYENNYLIRSHINNEMTIKLLSKAISDGFGMSDGLYS
jgi:hypothetical protein